jgi:tetratricopeptide (TPR) repeat protein
MKSKNPLVYSNLVWGFPRGASIRKSTQSGSRRVSALILRSAIAFSTFVLSVGVARSQPASEVSPPRTPTTISNGDEEVRIQRQVQSEVHRALSRRTIQSNVWLVILTLLPVSAIASLWLFRQAVIRAIADRVMKQLQGVEQLQNKLSSVKQSSENIIQQVKNTTHQLETEAAALKEKIKVEKDNLSGLTSELLSRQKLLVELDIKIKTAKQKVANLEIDFASQLSQLQSDAQRQKDITLNNLLILESSGAEKVSELQLDVEKQKIRFLENLEHLNLELTSQVSGTQQQKDATLENLQSIQSEFTSQISKIQSETQQQKDVTLENLKKVEAELQYQVLETQQQKDVTLENLKKVEVEFQSQVLEFQSETQQQKNKYVETLEKTYLEYFSNWQENAEHRKELIIDNLEKSGLDFISKFQRNAEKEKSIILKNLEKLESDVAQIYKLQINAQEKKEQVSESLQPLIQETLNRAVEEKIHESKQPEVLEEAVSPRLKLTADDYLEKGEILLSEKRYEDAIACYNKAVKIEPEKAVAWFKLGIANSRVKRYNDAIACYDKAIELKPDYHQAWRDRGVALGNLRHHQEAFISFDKATQFKKDDAVAWLNRGLALEELEEYDIAIASFDKVIELKPDSYKAWNHRGYGLVRLGYDEEALLCFDKALSIQPDYANAYYNKAACYALQRKVELAIENLQTAIDLNPSYKEDAETDIDFDEIAQDKRFGQLIASLPAD